MVSSLTTLHCLTNKRAHPWKKQKFSFSQQPIVACSCLSKGTLRNRPWPGAVQGLILMAGMTGCSWSPHQWSGGNKRRQEESQLVQQSFCLLPPVMLFPAQWTETSETVNPDNHSDPYCLLFRYLWLTEVQLTQRSVLNGNGDLLWACWCGCQGCFLHSRIGLSTILLQDIFAPCFVVAVFSCITVNNSRFGDLVFMTWHWQLCRVPSLLVFHLGK